MSGTAAARPLAVRARMRAHRRVRVAIIYMTKQRDSASAIADRPALEIEITEEMLAAAEHAYERWREAEPEFMVREILRAALVAR